jgi:hypothetical protein
MAQALKVEKPVRARRLKPNSKKDPNEPIAVAFDLVYGEDTAAQPGMVLFRIACEGRILAEVNMPPDEFLNLAHAFEVVTRSVNELRANAKA